MNYRITRIKQTLKKKPSNGFLLFLMGFFLSLFMLAHILYALHPLGGWVTSIGVFTTRSILLTLLLILSVLIFTLWRRLAAISKNAQKQLGIKSKAVSKSDTNIAYKTKDAPQYN